MKLTLLVFFLLSSQLWGTVEIQMVASDGEILNRQYVEENSETLAIYSAAGKSLFRITNLDKLTSLRSIIIPGGGFEILNDSFLTAVPQLEKLIIKAAGVPERWPNLKNCPNLKVLVLHYASEFPEGLEFAQGTVLELLGLPGLESFPVLKGYSSIHYLDLSHGTFPLPGPGILKEWYPRVESIYIEGIKFQPGSSLPQHLKLNGRDSLYEEKFPDAVM